MTIDKRFYRNVKEKMEEMKVLPKPRKRLLTGDGEFLPIILLESET